MGFHGSKSTDALLQSLAGRKPTPPRQLLHLGEPRQLLHLGEPQDRTASTLRYQSFLYPQFTKNPVKGDQIKRTMIGLVNIHLHREIPQGFRVKSVRVVSIGRGTKWYVVITIQMFIGQSPNIFQADVSVPDTTSYGRAMGVDVGLSE